MLQHTFAAKPKMTISGGGDAHGFGPLLAPVICTFGAFSLLDEVNVHV